MIKLIFFNFYLFKLNHIKEIGKIRRKYKKNVTLLHNNILIIFFNCKFLILKNVFMSVKIIKMDLFSFSKNLVAELIVKKILI
jgi:hypothetical protein